MKHTLIKYKAIVLAVALVLTATTVLAYLGFLLIDPTAIVENITILLLWSAVVAVVIYHIDQSGRRWQLAGQLLVLILSLILIIGLSVKMDMEDNPATLILMTLWSGYVVYLIAPDFVRKYRLLIVLVYGSASIYFTYNRYFNPDYIGNGDEILAMFFMPIPFFVLLWLYEQWKWFQALKADKAQAELALLKSQINPHFFFNTLNNLYSLAVNQSDQTPGVILKLSEMMRYTIYEGKKEVVSLEAELTNVQNFIELHKIRHKAKVDITFNQQIKGGYQVSPLLFINLVENAFKHGAERMTQGAFIHISVLTEGENIRFDIRNNFDPEERLAAKGTGLENLKKRLELLYPNAHTLDISISEEQDEYYCQLTLRP